ncbi:GFA family protein [Marinobacter zhanjiangensis]|uniref:GFA family protein n=1 Tax=Marinobacter zhanjiangensis TaxID=578215 RepID=UPI001D0FAB63|nr:GFA family protein [Marinobacter zhanjiangensis]
MLGKKGFIVYTGNCLCGGVHFQIQGELEPIQVCHCSQCRKAQGSPFATNTPVKEAAFQLNRGAELLRSFEASPGKQRFFCSNCGSPIYSKKDALPGVLRIRAGLINEPLSSKPVAHFYTGSKANWWPINDDLPQFEAAYVPQSSKA